MILAVDIGNTHIVLGCIEKGEIIKSVKISTTISETAHEYAAALSQVLEIESIDFMDFEGTIISSVVPQVTASFASAIKILTGQKPLIMGQTDIDPLIEIDMNGLKVSDIAGDLIATALAAKELYDLPAIVIDMGTATTITVVSREGVYIGGAILPGANTALQSLVKETSLLPAIEFEPPDRPIAKDTVNSMKSGIVYGSAGAIDGILDRFIDELGEKPTIIATGGMRKLISPYCRNKMILDGELLLKGLSSVWEKNKDKIL
jgi:type III pantothenate kinase